MMDFKTHFPGLRWMLAASVVICVIAGIWGVASAVSLGSGFAEMTAAANPLVCLLGVLGVVYLFVAAACAVACVLILMWLAVFADGDFWHGRDFGSRRERLAAGHNGAFWVVKITRNMARDRRNEADLEAMGWTVMRFWGSDALRRPDACAEEVRAWLAAAGRERGKPGDELEG